ncbi:hypothetical protein E4U54_000835 [Claviceps lovelessii]|nr:hypothetical protein E4U54_000835 [Claviceps lovelessii]
MDVWTTLEVKDEKAPRTLDSWSTPSSIRKCLRIKTKRFYDWQDSNLLKKQPLKRVVETIEAPRFAQILTFSFPEAQQLLDTAPSSSSDESERTACAAPRAQLSATGTQDVGLPRLGTVNMAPFARAGKRSEETFCTGWTIHFPISLSSWRLADNNIVFGTADLTSATMPTFISILRRRDSCIGWQCLTAAEQFGIIFSSVVVFLVFSLVYMYCLGKAVTYRRTRESIEPPQHMTSRVMACHAATNVPISRPSERHPAATLPVPAYYNQIAIPYAQSYATPIALRGIPVAASTNRQDAGPFMPGCQPSENSSAPGRQQEEIGRQTVDPNMAAETPRTMSPRWRQLLSRALRLPSGRARTIYSESNASSPTNTENEAGSHEDFARRDNGRARATGDQEEHQLRLRSAEDNRSADDGCDKAETGSITTNAATVHSDDFQIISPPSTIDLQHGM